MKWEHATLNIPVEKGEDVLGNETVTVYEHIPVRARLTHWTVEEKAGLDPNYTRTTRKAVIHLRQSKRINPESITIDGKEYQIVERQDLDRYLLLHIRSYKK